MNIDKDKNEHRFKTYKYLIKEQDRLRDHTVKCKCGHSILFGRKDRVICNYCGHYVYRNDKVKFKYKLREITKNERKN